MTVLVPYDLARTALAEAKTVDDVKDILDKAAAMAEYRRRAGDRSLEIDAIEIRMFAERRLGQMIAAQKAAAGLNRGTLRRGSESEPRDERPKLADSGIDKKLSAKAQKMAALPPDEFEAKLSVWRAEALETDRVVTNLLEIGRKHEQAQSRRDLAQALSDTSDQLLTGRKVPCVYIDPAWARKAGIGDRAYENHYPTEKWQAIIEIMAKASNRLQPNAWAFIWIPRAHMLALHPVKYKIAIDDGSVHEIEIKQPLIWAIARALGCDDYSTCFVWTKTDEDHPDEHGTFLVAKDQDEILCLYKKGNGLPKPPPDKIYGSNHRERSRPLGHSVKPPFYRKMIADMVGNDSDGRPLPVLEMFCRHDADNPLPENWEAWGNESEIPQEASGTAREAPGGSSSGEPSAVAASTSVSDRDGESAGDAAGEAGSRPRLQFLPDPDYFRFEDDGGPAAPDDDSATDLPDRFAGELLILKPQRAARR